MSQATLAEIESNRPETKSEVPRELADSATVRQGDKIVLDRRHFDSERAYTVLETRSNSLELERCDNQITLRRKRGDWYHGRSVHTHDVWVIANGEYRILECSECGEGRDPADFVRRENNRFVCAGCGK